MTNIFIDIITSSDSKIRNQSFLKHCQKKSLHTLMTELVALEKFRTQTDNLYERVRACLFLYAAYRFSIPDKKGVKPVGKTPFTGSCRFNGNRFAKNSRHVIGS